MDATVPLSGNERIGVSGYASVGIAAASEALEAPEAIAQRSVDETKHVRARIFCTNLILVGGFLGIGTAFYTFSAGWSPLNALYFSVVTLTTVGYGDLAPESDFDKCFTVGFVLCGIAIIGFQLRCAAVLSTCLPARARPL